MTQQVFHLKDTVPTSKPDVPATHDNTPSSHQATRLCNSPRAQLPKEDGLIPDAVRVRRNAKPLHRPNPRQAEAKTKDQGGSRRPIP